MKKGKTVKVGIVIALLLLVVGFAVVSTQLNITGTAKLKGNADDFAKSIRFVADTDPDKHASISSSNETKNGVVKVSGDGKSLTFITPILDTVNETATVSYYVENVGEYDARLGEITCTPKSEENPDLLDYIEVTWSKNYDGLELLHGTQTSEAATVQVKQTKIYASDEEANITITCTLPAESIQK